MMNINNLYLIDKDTYLEHINDKVRLCAIKSASKRSFT